MTSSSVGDRNSRTINTAACLIIGDEVLGGKVGFHVEELRNVADFPAW